MPKVFIGVGSNLGDRAGYLEFAKRKLLSGGVTGLDCSPVYETEPVDAEGGPFLNAVWSFDTQLAPQALLKKLHEIETEANRRRNKPNQARTLDLDILFYGDQVIREPEMTVPHPRLHERVFVLAPFCDLAPDFVHPIFKKTMKELLKALSIKR
ncbi:MAG: 2-amino-4-hydroxy-6-hydroxymethyldihydropteridine diphosphokinase [Candidatus Omnitrophica bacterium]|nr:2-amino-4-hydroxy-6-hydroxymethyldihydropteridine diphosphokinase [Candidatus Omnitrophota bacterium]